MSIVFTDTVPGPDSERQVHHRVYEMFVLFGKSLRVKLSRVRKVLRVAVDRINGYLYHFSFTQLKHI